MTNILVPTDFTSSSLQLAVQAIQSIDARNINILLFHAFEMPSSEFELLDPYRQRPYAGLITDSFRQECKQLKEKYSTVLGKINFRCMEGSTVPLFRNFINANEIDLIYCPEHYQFKPVHKRSIDPRPLFKRSGTKVVKEAALQKKAAVKVTMPAGAAVFAGAH